MELIQAHIGTPITIKEAHWTDTNTKKYIGLEGTIESFNNHSDSGGFAVIVFPQLDYKRDTFHYTELTTPLSLAQIKSFHNLNGVKILKKNTLGRALKASQKRLLLIKK